MFARQDLGTVHKPLLSGHDAKKKKKKKKKKRKGGRLYIFEEEDLE